MTLIGFWLRIVALPLVTATVSRLVYLGWKYRYHRGMYWTQWVGGIVLMAYMLALGLWIIADLAP